MDKKDIIDIVQGYLNANWKPGSEEYNIAINFFKSPKAETLIQQWEDEGKLVIPPVPGKEEMDEASEVRLSRIMKIIYKLENENLSPKRKGSSIPPYLKTVAIIFITAILAWLLVDWNNQLDSASVDLITQNTARGQKVTLTLADGTTVQMNSESTLTYPKEFNGKTREVTLSGEAFFMVKRNEAKPFIVKTENNLATKVLGTSFNIKAFDKETTEITVASGKVQVFTTHPGFREEEEEPNLYTDGVSITLTPGEQAVYDQSKGSLKKSNVNATDFIAWKDGILKFDNTRLDEVLETLSRWYGVDFKLENDQLKACTIIGEYHNESLVSVLENLSFVLKIDYKIQDGVLIGGSGECN